MTEVFPPLPHQLGPSTKSKLKVDDPPSHKQRPSFSVKTHVTAIFNISSENEDVLEISLSIWVLSHINTQVNLIQYFPLRFII